MKTMFIDESGREKQFFLLCGVIVDDNDLVNLTNSILSFKYKNEFSSLKDLRKPMNNKIDLISEIRDILDLYDLKVIAVVLGDNTLNEIDKYCSGKYKEFMKRYGALKYLVERFHKHLEKTEETGQIVFDSLDRETKKLFVREFYDLITEKSFQMAFRNQYDFEKLICPAMCFSDDNYHCVLQASDLIGFALNKAIEVELHHKNFNQLNPDRLRHKLNYLSIYWPLFEKNPFNGNVKGYGIKMWNRGIYSNSNYIISKNPIAIGVSND